jgi:hypothetical protein
MSDVTDTKQQRDPWTAPDPQPEDFDEFLSDPNRREVQRLPGNPDAKVNCIRDDEVEALLGPDHPIVKWLKETGRVA